MSATPRHSGPSHRPAPRRWLGPVLVGSGLVLAASVLAMLRTGPPGDLAAGTSGTRGPVLQVDRTVIDLGKVPLGEFVQASFVLTNAGDGRLQLTDAPYVRAVAGC